MKIITLTKKVALISALGALAPLNSALGQIIPVDPRTAVTATMDGGTARTGNVWYEMGVVTAFPTTGLKTGLITSQADTNSTYLFQPAVGRNAFLIDAAHPTGTITFETPMALYGFSFAGSDGNGAATVTPTLNFTDGTSATLAPLAFGDWFNGSPIVQNALGRIDLAPPNTTNNVGGVVASGNPRVLAVNVTNSAANATQMISSIYFNWKGSGANTHTCIFALSGDTSGMGHYTPVALTPESYNQDMLVGVAEVSQNAYVQENLVADRAGVAPNTDTNLVNPWGIVTSASSPFWVSDQATGLSTVYNSTGAVETLVVTVPTSAGGAAPSLPTGIIYNGTTNFAVPNSGTNAPAHFIFATQQGTISGWASGLTSAVLEVDNSAAEARYDGLAIATIGTNGDYYLYAANFYAGTIDVFDSNYKPVTNGAPLTTNGAPFTDTNVPAGFAPFNVQAIGGKLYVTYAMQDTNKLDDVAGAGNGYVDVFDTTGKLLQRFATNGPLNSPWGLALAPASFGSFSGALLVGNFGDGKINAFDASLGTPLGPLLGTNGAPMVIGGLWGLIAGNGGNGGATNMVYFTAAGSRAQTNGLLGSIAFQANQVPGVPWELLQTVNGFQDDFNLDTITSTTLNTNWVAVTNSANPTPEGQYELANGVLRVFPTLGDPNHLLYMGPGGSNTVQEVLARIRVTGFGTNSDGPRGGIAVAAEGPTGANPSRGIDLHFRDYKSDGGTGENNQSERKFKLLYDGLSWGPQGLTVNGTEVAWANNVWYWMRLRQDSKAAGGTNDVFGKVWPSDGVTPEPAEWQMVWDYVPGQVLSKGFAGIAGASGNGFAQTEMDYILIKAEGMPSVKANFGVFGPPVNAPEVTGITAADKTLTVDWFGGSYLESATSLMGPWSVIANPGSAAPYSPLKLTITNAVGEFYRVGQ